MAQHKPTSLLSTLSPILPTSLMLASLLTSMATVYLGRLSDGGHTRPQQADWQTITDVGQKLTFDVVAAHGPHVSVMFRVVRDYVESDLSDRVMVCSKVQSTLTPYSTSNNQQIIALHAIDESFVTFNGTSGKVSAAAPLMELKVENKSTLDLSFIDLDISREEKGVVLYADLFASKKVFVLVALQYSQIDAATQDSMASTVILGFLTLSFLYNLAKVCKNAQFFTLDYIGTCIGYMLCFLFTSGMPVFYPSDLQYNKYVGGLILRMITYWYVTIMLVRLMIWKSSPLSYWLYQILVFILMIAYVIFGLLKHSFDRGFYNNKSYSLKDYFKVEALKSLVDANRVIFPLMAYINLGMIFCLIIFRCWRMKKQHLEMLAMLGLATVYMKYKETADYIGLLHHSFDGHYLEYAVPVFVYAFAQSLVGSEDGVQGFEITRRTRRDRDVGNDDHSEEKDKILAR
jgi:hypothetical protein